MNAIPETLPGRWVGFRTLLYKEVLRFWKVSSQTVAAPVLVGTMLTAAARARRRSLCVKSKMRWSLV